MVYAAVALAIVVIAALSFKPLVRWIVARRLGPERVLVEGGDVVERIEAPKRVAVIGGGLAGIAAASTLAERGFTVELYEAEAYLGGKIGAWSTTLPDGTSMGIGHGFHAFFRHYYNLDRFLERLALRSTFRSIGDYQIVERDGTRLSFAGIDRTPILNLLSLARRGIYSLTGIVFGPARDLMGIFLEYDREETFARFDQISFARFADDAKLPRRLRLAFGTFARAFFADEDRMSLAELVKCFHFYFLGHSKGLIYDYPVDAYEPALVGPIRAHLEALGVRLRLSTPVRRLRLTERFEIDGAEFDDVVIAANVIGARKILESAEGIAPVAGLDGIVAGQRYAVYRVWIDRAFTHDVRDFVITESERVLDAIAICDRYEPEARAWAEREGGAVLELHCYAVPDDVADDAVASMLFAEVARRFDLENAKIIHEDLQLRRDFPAFHVGRHATRPTVDTGTEGLYLAGDWVKASFPSMLMEGAFTAGLIAANRVLDRYGLAKARVESIPHRGVMAGMPSPPAREKWIRSARS